MTKNKRGETPLMRQYYKIKEENPGAILLFRMGDFYETFGDDARKVAPILGITLTKRANGKAANVALAGFPHHALETYLPKLIRAGLRVAICEQTEDPKKTKKLVKRDVVEVVSPGVSLREQLLEPSRPSYLAALHFWGDEIGLALIDVSTGEFMIGEVAEPEIVELLDAIDPSEILVEKGLKQRISQKLGRGRVITEVEPWMLTTEFAEERLLQHFGTHSLKGFGVDELLSGVVAAGAALEYVSDAQKSVPTHLKSIRRLDMGASMQLDQQTRRNLELLYTQGSRSQDDSLLGILDRTRTPMGARLLRKWILLPLRSSAQINERLDAVEEAQTSGDPNAADVQDILSNIGDIERLATRIAVGRATPRDIVQLKMSLEQIPRLKTPAARAKAARWAACASRLTHELDLIERIDKALNDDPPATMSKGGVIRNGYNAELDELRSINRTGKEWIARLQQDEIARTGIPSLKVGFNKVFGYYLEVTNAHKARVPDDYIRKQTLVNAERYITPALKEYEEKVLSAEEKIVSLEIELFERLREYLAEHAEKILANAAAVAEIDCYCSLATVATANTYVRPQVDDTSVLNIVDGRHPVVEKRLPPGEIFIPNSVFMDPASEQILIVTGPNMAGKSVVLRQTGLIVLMAQAGSFVPAREATIGVVDRVFTRVGASDNIAEGESTFLVEMNETANILNNATPSSLILLDEVGRGTSTFDGMSIAWALVEYLHETSDVAAKTMFATHYHELNELATTLDRVRNYRIHVEEHDGKVIFLRKMIAGGADHSFGIEVARMAGLPKEILVRAGEILQSLEEQQLAVASEVESGDGSMAAAVISSRIPERATSQISLFAGDPVLDDIRQRLDKLDPDRTTPVEALLVLVELKKILDRQTS